MVLNVKPSDGGAPFFGTSCRYRGQTGMIYEYDAKKGSFHAVGEDLPELFSYPLGVASGTYRGAPALFMNYIKNTPSGGSREISGYGVTVFYREGGAWKKQRILKGIETPVISEGIAVADLDGDGLDDLVFADDARNRVRVFFQKTDGSFEEMATELEPKYVNHATCVRLVDVDGDGRKDVVVMVQFLTGDETRAGGFKVFRNVR
jgi:hypothetical protein